MSTIKDVAKMAGVSISTVSLACNSPERVSEATRKKIFAAVRKLNYTPMKEKRKVAIKKHKSETIAVICPKLVGPYFFEILRGISETLYMNNKEMVLYSGDEAVERHFMEIVENHAYQGIILVYEMVCDEYLRAAVEADFPTVMCCYGPEYKGVGSVFINNDGVGKLVADYFIKQKFETIGMVGTGVCDSITRADAFLQTLQKSGIEVPEKWRLPCELTEDAAYKSMDKFLQSGAQYPQAFFCLNDDSAIGAIEAIKKYGLRIPEDISVIGCDDLNRSKYHTPSLSTVATPKIEMGMLAVNMLMRKLAGIPSEEIVLNGKLVLRESCI